MARTRNMKPKYAVRFTTRDLTIGGTTGDNIEVVNELFTAEAPALKLFSQIEKQHIDSANFTYEVFTLVLIRLAGASDPDDIVGHVLRATRFFRSGGRWEFFTAEDSSRGEGPDQSDEVAWVQCEPSPVYKVGVLQANTSQGWTKDALAEATNEPAFKELTPWTSDNVYAPNEKIEVA